MFVRNLSALLVIGSMTGSSHSFAMHRSLTFRRMDALRYSSDPPEPDQNIQIQSDEDGTLSFMGIDEDYIPFPHRDFTGPDVVRMCMEALADKMDEPYTNAGLEVCFNFSSDRCRASQGGSLEQFIQYAHNPVFSTMINAIDWKVLSTGPIIQGTQTRGAMQTQLIEVHPENGRQPKRFLWTLQQERRPPRQGCWLVHECINVENAYDLTL